jgi:hypothetical protein
VEVSFIAGGNRSTQRKPPTRDNDGVIFHVSSTVTAEFIRLEVMYMKHDYLIYFAMFIL